MKKIVVSLITAAGLALSSTAASAQPMPPRRHHHHNNSGAVAGLVIGAIAGAAIASQRRHRPAYGYAPAYGDPYYRPRYYAPAPRYYAPQPRCWMQRVITEDGEPLSVRRCR